MASERQSQLEEGNDRNPQVPGKENSKRRHGGLRQADISVIRNKMRARRMNDLGLYLGPLLRKVLQEELPPILQRHGQLFPGSELATVNQSGTSGCRALRLCFTNTLPKMIFTHTKITSEDDAPLRIALCDAKSENSIVKEGSLSSARIMMCALNGEFGSDESEDWSAEEFNANISPCRENRGQLLKGDRFITLENGVAFVPNIEFTDNSCWTRSRTFRLGAKVVQNEANVIREGRSEAFVVKDKRGEPYKKHDRPSLNDEIWRLKRIAKGGKIHRQLSSNQVKTVKDLLQLYITNPPSLQKKMGNIAKKTRDTIIEHAQLASHIDDGKRYIYHYPPAEKSIALVFNSIYKLVEVSFDGHNYRSLESLNSEEKRMVERAKQNAYENLKDFVPVETLTYGAGLQLQNFELFPSYEQGQPSNSSSLFDEVIQDLDQVGTDQMLLECSGGFNIDGDAWNLNGSQFQFPNYVSPPSPWSLGPGNPFVDPCDDGAYFSHHSSFLNSAVVISSKGKRKTVWNKIRNALKLVIPFVAKRKAKLSIPCKDVTIRL